MSEDIETKKETIREMSCKIDEIRFEMQELIDWYSEEMEKINKYEYQNAEKAFSIYIEHGITIGTKFRFDGKPEIYTVIGICPDGFRCSRPDAELVGRSTTLLPAKDPDLIKEKIGLIQILNEKQKILDDVIQEAIIEINHLTEAWENGVKFPDYCDSCLAENRKLPHENTMEWAKLLGKGSDVK